MLKSFRRGYEILVKMPACTWKDRQLAQLMTDMERYYNIPMNKARFEAEVPADVRALYLAVANERDI